MRHFPVPYIIEKEYQFDVAVVDDGWGETAGYFTPIEVDTVLNTQAKPMGWLVEELVWEEDSGKKKIDLKKNRKQSHRTRTSHFALPRYCPLKDAPSRCARLFEGRYEVQGGSDRG
jgi:hypothetical protein